MSKEIKSYELTKKIIKRYPRLNKNNKFLCHIKSIYEVY
jgi:hypothetical protein